MRITAVSKEKQQQQQQQQQPNAGRKDSTRDDEPFSVSGARRER
jgi:hypothetical protein